MLEEYFWQNIPKDSELEVEIVSTPGVACHIQGLFDSPQNDHDDLIQCGHHKKHKLFQWRSELTILVYSNVTESVEIIVTLHKKNGVPYPGSPLRIKLPRAGRHSGGIHLVLDVP